MSIWSRYGKAIVAVAAVLVTAVTSAVSDHHITPAEGVQILIAAATAAAVYLVPVIPQWPWLKTAVAVILAVLNVLAAVVLHGWHTTDLSALILAALTTLGVGVAPAVSDTHPPTPAQP